MKKKNTTNFTRKKIVNGNIIIIIIKIKYDETYGWFGSWLLAVSYNRYITIIIVYHTHNMRNIIRTDITLMVNDVRELLYVNIVRILISQL